MQILTASDMYDMFQRCTFCMIISLDILISLTFVMSYTISKLRECDWSTV